MVLKLLLSVFHFFYWKMGPRSSRRAVHPRPTQPAIFGGLKKIVLIEKVEEMKPINRGLHLPFMHGILLFFSIRFWEMRKLKERVEWLLIWEFWCGGFLDSETKYYNIYIFLIGKIYFLVYTCGNMLKIEPYHFVIPL